MRVINDGIKIVNDICMSALVIILGLRAIPNARDHSFHGIVVKKKKKFFKKIVPHNNPNSFPTKCFAGKMTRKNLVEVRAAVPFLKSGSVLLLVKNASTDNGREKKK